MYLKIEKFMKEDNLFIFLSRYMHKKIKLPKNKEIFSN